MARETESGASMLPFIQRLSGNAPLLLIATTVIWGGNAVAGKFAVGEVSPFMLTAARWWIASVILLVMARDHLKVDWPVLRPRLGYLFILGATGFAAFNGFLYTALQYTSAINVTIIQAGMPLLVFILNFSIFGAPLSAWQVIGYSLTLVGVLLTAAGGDLRNLAALHINFGDLIMIGGAFLYAAFTVGLRAKPNVHWLSFLTCLVAAAALSAIPMVAYEALSGALIWPASVTGWTIVFYTALLPSIVAQGFFIRGNELIGANKASLYINLVPIFGSLLAVALLGEAFHLYHGFALALVIGGIILAQRLSSSGG